MKKSLPFLMVLSLLMMLAGCGNNAALVNNGTENTPANNNAPTDRFVFDQPALTATYYHRENYEAGYAFRMDNEKSGAFDAAKEPPSQPGTAGQPETQPEPSITEEESNMSKIEILIGNKTYPATLYENEAANALMDLLPLTLDMSELNGNEKYKYLDTTLPENAGKPSGIQTGDLMLYGDRCLVLFYESFSTSYTYTALGRVDDPTGLAAALGSGSVQVTFRKG